MQKEHPQQHREAGSARKRVASEREEPEDKTLDSEQSLKFVYTRIPAMVHSIDRDGRIMEVSDRWLEVLRYPRDEVVGRRSVEFLTEESQQFAETVTLPKFWRTGCASNVSYQFVRKDGEVVDILLSAVAESDTEGNPLQSLAVLTEVSDRGPAHGVGPQRSPYGFTPRELTVLELIANGKSDKQIASELFLSPRTVYKHVSRIIDKMAARSRTEVATRALREKLIV